MAMCDMCGEDTTLFRADIEGTELNVCRECARHGKIIAPARKELKESGVSGTRTSGNVKIQPRKELIQVISDDYSNRIRNAREKRGLKQEELAKALHEKESVIQKMETGSFEPSLRLARKLERFLRIKLVEQHEEKHQASFKATGTALTIGDVLELKE